MYGAYQAGVWKVLADFLQPDLIVGASICAVNGWAIAGRCPPDELIYRWLHLDDAAQYRWKLPRSLFSGVLDSRALQAIVRDIHASYQPCIPYAAVLTDLLKLQPRVLQAPQVTWEHLLASTAIIGIFDQVRIDGRIYSDGGLLYAVPLWAAAELGATRALVVNLLPEPPGLVARTFVPAVRRLSRFRPTVPEGLEVTTIAPPRLLGTPAESLYWTRENTRRWIQAGERDAATIKHSLLNCFERE